MKKLSMFILIALAVLSVYNSHTEAARWELVGEGWGKKLYIDLDSIFDGPTGSKEVVGKTEYEKPECRPYDNASKKIKCVTFDTIIYRLFPNKTYCFHKLQTYYTDGSIVESFDTCLAGPFEITNPDSAANNVWKILFANPQSGKDNG